MAGKDSESHLTLSQAHVSRIVAMGMVMLVFVFVAGYYLGKKSQSEELATHMQQGSFADQIHSSLYTMYHAPGTDSSGTDSSSTDTLGTDSSGTDISGSHATGAEKIGNNKNRDEINKEEHMKGQQR